MKSTHNILRIALFACIVFSMLAISGCKKESYMVKYEVVCSPDGFIVSYMNSLGSLAQAEIGTGTWSTTFEAEPETYVQLTAMADNENATITVNIYHDEVLFKTLSSTGDFAVVSVSGFLP